MKYFFASSSILGKRSFEAKSKPRAIQLLVNKLAKYSLTFSLNDVSRSVNFCFSAKYLSEFDKTCIWFSSLAFSACKSLICSCFWEICFSIWSLFSANLFGSFAIFSNCARSACKSFCNASIFNFNCSCASACCFSSENSAKSVTLLAANKLERSILFLANWFFFSCKFTATSFKCCLDKLFWSITFRNEFNWFTISENVWTFLWVKGYNSWIKAWIFSFKEAWSWSNWLSVCFLDSIWTTSFHKLLKSMTLGSSPYFSINSWSFWLFLALVCFVQTNSPSPPKAIIIPKKRTNKLLIAIALKSPATNKINDNIPGKLLFSCFWLFRAW